MLNIDEDLVPVVIPTKYEILPLIKLYEKINFFIEIKKYSELNGIDEEWLKRKMGASMVVGKGRWNKLLSYLKIKQTN